MSVQALLRQRAAAYVFRALRADDPREERRALEQAHRILDRANQVERRVQR
jgi:hypothetical protein